MRRIPASEAALLGLGPDSTDNNTTAYVALKYYQPDFECLSAWRTEELRILSAFIQKLSKTTWAQIYKTGGKPGNKDGLGYTLHGPGFKTPPKPQDISEDITFFELRVTRAARVHGFRCQNAFFLVWLDRAHQVCR